MKATLAACLVIFAVTASLRFLSTVSFSNDEYVSLAGAQQMLLGEWPTRDFFDPGLPLMYAVAAASQLLFGRNLFAEAMLTSGAFALAAALTVVAAARLSRSLAVGIVAAAVEVAIFPRGYAYPEILLYAAAPLVFWWYQAKPHPARAFGVAAFVQVAFLFRHDHGLFIGVGALVAAAAVANEGGWRGTASRVATLASMIGAAAIPYLAYLALNGGIAHYFAQGIAFSRGEAANNHLTVPVFGTGVNREHNSEALLFYLFYLLPVAALGVLAALRERRSAIVDVLPVIALALLVDRAFLRDELSTRLANAIVPALLLAAWLFGETRRVESTARRSIVRLGAGAAAVVCVAAVISVGRTVEELDRASLFGGLRRMPERFVERSAELHDRFNERQMSSRATAILVPFFHYVDRCTAPRDHLLLPGFLPDVAVYAQRPFAAGRMTILNGYVDRPSDRRELQAQLEAQAVPFALVTPNDKQLVWEAYPELAAFIENEFRPLVSFNNDEGRVVVEVFANRRLQPRGVDAETGWPCFS